jgi:hypothetical protein
MLGAVAEAGEMKTIRPRPGPSLWAAIVILAGMFIAPALYRPGQAPWLLACASLIAVIGWIRVRAVRLVITDSAVRVRQGWVQAEKEAARSNIVAIHYFPGVISFRGPGGEPMMKVAPNWTLRQMLEVAGVLEVPLFDHTRWFGLRKAAVARLAYDPPSGPRLTPR